jgi:hypothetical protein
MLPQKDIEYLPLVFKLLLGLDVSIIREVLTGGGKAQAYVERLLQKAKELQDSYDKGAYGTEDV